jgi:hypothetical protein
MSGAMDLLFFIAGSSLLAHIALCLLLQNMLLNNSVALNELFAIPNERLVKKSRFRLLRLLRVRYYFLWQQTSQSLGISRGENVLVSLAKITGLLMPICSLGFIALSIIQAFK